MKKIEYVEDSVMPRLKNIAYMNMNNPEKTADGPGDGIYDWATGITAMIMPGTLRPSGKTATSMT